MNVEYETDSEIISVNAWICGNKVLRMVENPFTPKEYHI